MTSSVLHPRISPTHSKMQFYYNLAIHSFIYWFIALHSKSLLHACKVPGPGLSIEPEVVNKTDINPLLGTWHSTGRWTDGTQINMQRHNVNWQRPQMNNTEGSREYSRSSCWSTCLPLYGFHIITLELLEARAYFFFLIYLLHFYPWLSKYLANNLHVCVLHSSVPHVS